MSLMPVAEALQRVLADAKALPAETVLLVDALGRVLTEDMAALSNQPPAMPFREVTSRMRLSHLN